MPKISLLEEEKEGIIKFPQNASQPNSEIAPEFKEITDHQKGEENVEVTVSSRESEKSVSEGDDGFKTPPSQKIPAITQCPPAPTKTSPRFSKLKRQASPACRRRLQFDAMTEVESILLLTSRDFVEEQKIKKSRSEI
ncbi:hypothetical protein DH2020_040200 [Rehmannia glutinosa]|uniref:Uncharacterized protein n=1 Tax=Rehmannia glutinosa TaxID=99300 RepID=A0ABR0UVT1_REHGL